MSERKDLLPGTTEGYNIYKRNTGRSGNTPNKHEQLQPKDLLLNNISNIEAKQDDSSRLQNSVIKQSSQNLLKDNDSSKPAAQPEKINQSITTVIPESKLLAASDDDIIYQSYLKRLLNQKIQNHVSQNFCDRFVLCTKTSLRLYKSKEQFLKLMRPINIIPFTMIKSVNRFSLNNLSNIKLFFFVIEFNELPGTKGGIRY
jgi:hypothetical protein